MASLVRVSSSFTVSPDKLREFKQLVKEFAARVSAEDLGTSSYQWFESEDGSEFNVIEVHDSSEACLAHLANFEPHAERFEATCEMTRADIYGEISPELRQVFEPYGAKFHRSLEGFTR